MTSTRPRSIRCCQSRRALQCGSGSPSRRPAGMSCGRSGPAPGGWPKPVHGCERRWSAAGYADPQPPTVHHLWGLSVVLAAQSRSGTAFLKCSGDHFRGEAAVTQALAERSPAHLPTVIAIEPERGWLLMRDFDAPELGEQPEASWGVGLDALLELQQAWLGRGDELVALGADSRPLTDLAAWVEASAGDTALLAPLTSEKRSQWLDAVPTMVQACHRLNELGPEPSLVHGDFHPWNVAAGAERCAHLRLDGHVRREPDARSRDLRGPER